MHIFSWNVNGLPTTLKDVLNRYGSIDKYFKDTLHADIVCFQEAKVQEEKLEKWLACVPGYQSFWAFSRTKKGYSGVVTYVKDGLSPLDAQADCLDDLYGSDDDTSQDDESDKDSWQEGRLMCTDHGTFVLLNVYVPNAGDRPARARLGFKLRFLRALRQRCDDIVERGKHVILVGDLNISHRSVDIFRDWSLEAIYSQDEIAWMDSLLSHDYVDLFRHFHPDATDVFSVWDQRTDARSHNEGQRIDYTICDLGFLDQVISAEVVKMKPKKWSDHAAVTVTLKEQPKLPPHLLPAIASSLMKRFQEDSRQQKLTFLLAGKQLPRKRPQEPSQLGERAEIGAGTQIGLAAPFSLPLADAPQGRPSRSAGETEKAEAESCGGFGDPWRVADAKAPQAGEGSAAARGLGEVQDETMATTVEGDHGASECHNEDAAKPPATSASVNKGKTDAKNLAKENAEELPTEMAGRRSDGSPGSGEDRREGAGSDSVQAGIHPAHLELQAGSSGLEMGKPFIFAESTRRDLQSVKAEESFRENAKSKSGDGMSPSSQPESNKSNENASSDVKASDLANADVARTAGPVVRHKVSVSNEENTRFHETSLAQKERGEKSAGSRNKTASTFKQSAIGKEKRAKATSRGSKQSTLLSFLKRAAPQDKPPDGVAEAERRTKKQQP